MADHTLVAPEVSDFDLSFPTETDLSAKQYFFMKLDTSELVVAATANDKTLGILQNKPNGSSTQATAIVRVLGPSKVSLTETVVFGNFLTPTSTGAAEICDAANEEFGARSMTSGESGDLALVNICFGEVTASDA